MAIVGHAIEGDMTRDVARPLRYTRSSNYTGLIVGVFFHVDAGEAFGTDVGLPECCMSSCCNSLCCYSSLVLFRVGPSPCQWYLP